MINMKMTRNQKTAIVVIAIVAGVSVTGIALCQTTKEQSIVKIEESMNVQPWTKYFSIVCQPATTITIYIVIPKLVGGSFSFFKLLDNETIVATNIGLSSKNDLYLKNGTAKVFWGNSASLKWSAMFFKDNAWWIGQSPISFNETNSLIATKQVWKFATS